MCQILTTVKRLGLRPRRTLRLVLWTAEEIGVLGGNEYWRRHQDEMENMVLVMESDIGTFSPLGLHFHNSKQTTLKVLNFFLNS